MSHVMEQAKPYLADFERFERGTAAVTPPFVQGLRKIAMARFAELGFPGPRDEEWRFTPLAPLLRQPFVAGPIGESRQAADGYHKLLHGDQPGSTLLAANGMKPFLLEGSRPLPAGVIVCGLAEAVERFPSLVEPHLGRHADFKGHAFAALNTAFLHDGAFVRIPPGITVEEPIYLRFLAAAWNEHHPYAWQRRTLIVCGDDSRASVVEGYFGLPGVAYFTNAVSEVAMGKNAHLDHYKVLEEGNEAFHFHGLEVQQDQSSTFASCSVAAKGKWVRNEVHAALAAEGCECTLNGLYLASGDQFIDNHTRIDHAKPHCTSHEFYKGILDGRARGVFNGKIFVHPDAQKTDARQTNKTLLLSDDAMIDAKPELEIYADDVKCTHGASIGQLDAEAIFYLRTRGLGLEAARKLLTYAFANDVIGRIRVDALRTQLAESLFASSQWSADEPRGEPAGSTAG